MTLKSVDLLRVLREGYPRITPFQDVLSNFEHEGTLSRFCAQEPVANVLSQTQTTHTKTNFSVVTNFKYIARSSNNQSAAVYRIVECF